MKRSELESFIMETYNAEADYPWLKYPNYEVFRHCNNRKWFALIMDVPKNKLGLQGEEVLEVVNFKCDPILIGTLREEPGFFPAYHMSKDSWITVALDGSVSDDKIKMLLDTSYEATASKTHKKCWQFKFVGLNYRKLNEKFIIEFVLTVGIFWYFQKGKQTWRMN